MYDVLIIVFFRMMMTTATTREGEGNLASGCSTFYGLGAATKKALSCVLAKQAWKGDGSERRTSQKILKAMKAHMEVMQSFK